jgi:hypothetical protein
LKDHLILALFDLLNIFELHFKLHDLHNWQAIVSMKAFSREQIIAGDLGFEFIALLLDVIALYQNQFHSFSILLQVSLLAAHFFFFRLSRLPSRLQVVAAVEKLLGHTIPVRRKLCKLLLLCLCQCSFRQRFLQLLPDTCELFIKLFLFVVKLRFLGVFLSQGVSL